MKHEELVEKWQNGIQVYHNDMPLNKQNLAIASFVLNYSYLEFVIYAGNDSVWRRCNIEHSFDEECDVTLVIKRISKIISILKEISRAISLYRQRYSAVDLYTPLNDSDFIYVAITANENDNVRFSLRVESDYVSFEMTIKALFAFNTYLDNSLNDFNKQMVALGFDELIYQ